MMNPMRVSQRFERLLDAYCRPDGSKWTGHHLDEATGGVVSRAFVRGSTLFVDGGMIRHSETS
jgi:hypothetical protein